jgi:hypothetical protein
LNEFARIVGLLTGNEAVRAALLRSGLDLTRSELDKGVGRDDFWNVEMEPMFNDKRLDVSAPCAVDELVLSRVDANSTPLDHRPAELLRRKVFEARAYFTRVYNNWSVSGQNDAENFTEFVKGPSNGSSTYPYLSMCAIPLFCALKCGRPDTDDEVLRWYVKTAPTGVTYDDEIDDDDGQSSERDQEPARSSIKRQRRVGKDSTNDHTQNLAAIVPAVEQV